MSLVVKKRMCNLCCRPLGIPGGSDGKEFACIAGDLGSISESGRFPGEEDSYPLQYSCLDNSMVRGAWPAIVHGIAKSWTRLSDWHTHSICIVLWSKQRCCRRCGVPRPGAPVSQVTPDISEVNGRGGSTAYLWPICGTLVRKRWLSCCNITSLILMDHSP